ncbi:hypothetical protein HMN09_00415000 [Mycena chlorophos]|uniref:Carbohydrate kinase PfkB domain-containing protein n=1 Tax=Mycena chlorophos TaxID=658473 RepID=A0A8H6TGH4_MYCCL|nr:hypothetical protein HMN09_00415000 [Mycena chlorophos]
MGRTQIKKKILPKPQKAQTTSPAPTIPALIEKAQNLIVQCDYGLAQRFITRILNTEPTNVIAKEMLGVVQLETGDISAAKATFTALLPPNPGAPSSPPPSAHLYLAQLCEDDPHLALKHYQAAIEILMGQWKGKERAEDLPRDDEAELKNNIVRALIGQVEIWMDPSYDLCYDPAAEKTCEELLQTALQTDPGNAEALQALASVRMSQQRPDDAKQCIEQAWSTWKDLDIDDPKIPPISARLATVKIFLELSLYTPALLVLQGVMASDDQDVEAWYLEGWCFFLMAEQAKENGGILDELTWQELATDARDCLETCKTLHENEGHPDAPLLEHAKELIAKLDELGIKPSPAGEEGEGDEEEWEDEDDEEDVVTRQAPLGSNDDLGLGPANEMAPPRPSLSIQHGAPLRVFACGTLFQTHTFSIPAHPTPDADPVVRAHSVIKTRGGSASTLVSLLSQFSNVETFLVAPLAGNDEGRAIIRELEREGVSTRYCKIWKNAAVPSAWVFETPDSKRTVVNYNPLVEIQHEEFVSTLGPLLAPENYTLPSTSPATPIPPAVRSRQPSTNPNSPAPFDWLHFEGRSVKTTLSNITGLDGLARERKWRSHCVFSVDVGRKGRQGVEALIPHADVIFLNKHYAQATSPTFTTNPRAFLLSLTSIAPPHALLVAYWGSDGAAVLSVPTKEYFQGSGWVEERSPPARGRRPGAGDDGESEVGDILSVRSGSDFWAGRHSGYASSSAFTASQYNDAGSDTGDHTQRSGSTSGHGHGRTGSSEDDIDSQGTEIPENEADAGVIDEVGAQDAFIAGMIYALTRRILPGAPYTPSATSDDAIKAQENDRGRWRLDECLRFATELSGRKARRLNWEGLGAEMGRAGWFDC